MKRMLSGLARFGGLGGLSFGLNLGLTALLHEGFGAAPEAAFAVALVVTFVVNFFACRYWVFEAGAEGGLRRQMTLFAVSSLGFRGAEYLVFLLLHSVAGLPYLGVAALVLALSFLVKFFYYRAVVFTPGRGPS